MWQTVTTHLLSICKASRHSGQYLFHFPSLWEQEAKLAWWLVTYYIKRHYSCEQSPISVLTRKHRQGSSKGGRGYPGPTRGNRVNNCLKVLRPTRHRTCHFGDVLPSQSLGLVLKNWNKWNKSKHASTPKYTTTYNEPQKISPVRRLAVDLC